MRFLDIDGQPTLWFALGELWNWHASPVSGFNPIMLPTRVYIRLAMEFFSDRPARFRCEYMNQVAHFYYLSRNWPNMDTAERATWHFETFPAMVRRQLGYSLWMVEDGYDRLRNAEDMRARCQGWHARMRHARHLTPERIAALLEAAAALLLARVDNNRALVIVLFLKKCALKDQKGRRSTLGPVGSLVGPRFLAGIRGSPAEN